MATVTIFVDNGPLVVTCSANPNSLWPPNNKFVTINVAVTVDDPHSGPAGFTLLSITNNETGPGDVQDWTVGTPDTQGQVRASRNGNGRIYTLTYEGKDLAGNTALCTTTVTVPKNQGGGVGATYDENQPIEDLFTDAISIPVETVTTLAAEESNTAIENSEAQPIQLFLPVIAKGGAEE